MRPTVLIVDDEFGIRKFLSEMLALEGYLTEEAEHGGPALEQMRASPQPLVVLLGPVMPYVDGEQVLEAVAADPTLAPRHRIIMVTANTGRASSGRIAELRRRLHVPLIPKPFVLDQILDALSEAAATNR